VETGLAQDTAGESSSRGDYERVQCHAHHSC